MPRTYRTPLGTRQYCNYAPNTLANALENIREGKMSQRAAAEAFNIPRSTLKSKVKNEHLKKPGGQTVLTAEEEAAFVDHIIVMSDYMFPVSSFDLRCIVKFYLDKQGKTVNKFKNNFPGEDWAVLFLRRHKILTTRMASNIKRQRANVSPEVIKEYIDHLGETVSGVPPSNIWNFDESNLTDDPGQKKVITKRGCKYPERMMNSSKSAISVMFVGNAEGEVLPPYVVYKSEHLWQSWMEGGPEGCRYNRTSSGWFDLTTFEDFFVSQMLPRLKKQDGKKVLIGDNLSSHISRTVLTLCKENNVSFVALPPNSTHLTQPLDVAYFRPLKAAWRKILESYKTLSGDGVLQKSIFPRLLKKLVNQVMEPGRLSLIAGFKKCGIYPLNANAILSRMPCNVQGVNEEINVSASSNVSDSLLEFLSKNRYGDNENAKKNGKRRKVQVPPGKSITEEDLPPEEQTRKGRKTKGKKTVEMDSEEVPVDENNNSKKKKEKKKGPKNKKRALVISSDEENEDADNPNAVNDCDEFDDSDAPYTIGSYVIVDYEDEKFPGVVVNMDVDQSAEVKVMVMRGIDWGWPEKDDIIWYDKEKILEVIAEPTLKPSTSRMSHRDTYCVPEITKYRKL